MSRVQTPHTAAELVATLAAIPETQLRIHYYTASWCPPCRAIAPVFEQLSRKHTDVAFVKIDTDALQAAAQEAAVSSIPAFHFWIGRKRVHQMVGANAKALEDAIDKHRPKTRVSDSAAGAPPASSETFGVPGQLNITSLVDVAQTECLNQAADHPVHHIFHSGKHHLASDADEQLLITIPFTQQVKLHSIKLYAHLPNAPKTIKLFVNPAPLDFDEAERLPATQELVLTEKDYAKETVIPLRYVKFQRVSSLALFVKDNLGDEDVTVIHRLHFIGTPVDTTRMENLRQMDDE